MHLFSPEYEHYFETSLLPDHPSLTAIIWTQVTKPNLPSAGGCDWGMRLVTAQHCSWMLFAYIYHTSRQSKMHLCTNQINVLYL